MFSTDSRPDLYRQHIAAVRIQTNWRAYKSRRFFRSYRKAIVALQCCWRSKVARKELRNRRKEAREATKLLQDKQALDVKLKETIATLEHVQNQRNELKQAYKVPIAHSSVAMKCSEELRLLKILDSAHSRGAAVCNPHALCIVVWTM